MTKKIGLTLVILVLALGVMGATYGLWGETVWLRAFLETGEVDVEMSVHDVYDVESMGYGCEPKDIGTCSAELVYVSVPGFQPDSDGPNRLNIYVGNAYPSYECHFTFDVRNIGTIPVHFQVTGPEGHLPPEAIEAVDCPAGGLEAQQLHPGDSYDCHLMIHFDNDTPGIDENGFYAIGWDIFAYQYNETP